MEIADKAKLIALVEAGDIYGLVLEQARMRGGKITAEQVKDFIRRYAEQEHPDWGCASVSVRIGSPGAHVTETLVTYPAVTPCESLAPRD